MRRPSRNSKTCKTGWTWVGDRLPRIIDRVSGGIGHSGGKGKTRRTCAHPKERSRFPPLDGHHSYRLVAKPHGGEPSPSPELTSF